MHPFLLKTLHWYVIIQCILCVMMWLIVIVEKEKVLLRSKLQWAILCFQREVEEVYCTHSERGTINIAKWLTVVWQKLHQENEEDDCGDRSRERGIFEPTVRVPIAKRKLNPLKGNTTTQTNQHFMHNLPNPSSIAGAERRGRENRRERRQGQHKLFTEGSRRGRVFATSATQSIILHARHRCQPTWPFIMVGAFVGRLWRGMT